MEKLNKKKLVIVIIAVLVAIAVITLTVILINKSKNDGNPFKNAGSISAAESEFEALKIKDIELTYKEDGSETILAFSIENATDQRVEKQSIKILLLGENDGVISSLQTNLGAIEAKSSFPLNITLAGNIQGIKTLKLAQVEEVKADEAGAEQQ